MILLKKEGLSILNNEMKRFMSQNMYVAYTQEFTSILQLLIEELQRIEKWIRYEH